MKYFAHPALRMLAVYLILFNQMLDTSVANLALSNIASDLFIDVYHAAWIVTSFGTGVVVALPLGSIWTKRTSPEFVLSVGCALFIVASMGCGVAEHPAAFILFRLLQGIGSGISCIAAFPIMIGIAGTHRMSFAVALCTSAISLAPVLGPIIGATVTNGWGWRYLFLMNVPVTAFALGILLPGFAFQPPASPEALGLRLLTLGWFAISVAALQLMLDFGEQYRWLASPTMVAALVVTLLASALFIVCNRRPHARVFNFSVFTCPSYAGTTAVLALGNGIIFASLVFLPLWLRTERHMPMLNAGVIVSVGSAVAALSTPFVGKYFPRNYYPAATLCSLSLTAVSFFMMSRFAIDTPTVYLVASRLVAGCGLAIFTTPLITMSLARLSAAEALDGNALSMVLRALMSNILVALSFTQYQRLSDSAHNHFAADADRLSYAHGALPSAVDNYLTGLFHTTALGQIFFATGVFFLLATCLLAPVVNQLKPKA